MGQIAGCLKQLVELSLTISQGSSFFKGIRGKIVHSQPFHSADPTEKPGSYHQGKYYRFTLLFSPDISFDDFTLVQSVIFSISLYDNSIHDCLLPELDSLSSKIKFSCTSSSRFPSFLKSVFANKNSKDFLDILDAGWLESFDSVIKFRSVSELFKKCTYQMESYLQSGDINPGRASISNFSPFSRTLSSIISGYNTTRSIIHSADASIESLILDSLSRLVTNIPEKYLSSFQQIYEKLCKQITTNFHSLYRIDFSCSRWLFCSELLLRRNDKTDVKIMINLPSLNDIKVRQDLLEKQAEALKARLDALDSSKNSVAKFSENDFTDLLNKVAEPKVDPWTLVFSGEGGEIYSNDSDSNLPPMLRIFTKICGATIKFIFDLYRNPEKRLSWDKNVKDLRVLEEYNENANGIIYIFLDNF